jgi:hypothetical protein
MRGYGEKLESQFAQPPRRPKRRSPNGAMALPSVGELRLDCVEVILLRLESDVSEVFRPISECAVLVEVGTRYVRDTRLRIALEPMKLHDPGVEVTPGNQRLDRGQKQRTVRLGNNADAALGGIRKNLRELRLRAGVKVDLWLLQINEAALICNSQSNEDWERLGDTRSDVSDADHIVGVARSEAADLEFYGGRCHSFGGDLLC